MSDTLDRYENTLIVKDSEGSTLKVGDWIVLRKCDELPPELQGKSAYILEANRSDGCLRIEVDDGSRKRMWYPAKHVSLCPVLETLIDRSLERFLLLED
jgi:hypothetical protein